MNSAGTTGGEEHVLVAGGANLGDAAGTLARAVESLREVIHIERVSALYRTEPEGLREQPDFHNLVCVGRTSLGPEDVLAALLEIERRAGRVRSVRNAARTLDLDLLAHGDRVVDRPGLRLPHPRLHERRFVLEPLVEVAPGWVHPQLGQTAAELLRRLPAGTLVERLGPMHTP
jgi:2-amino-4-hydroxy-6-hydroxymethyldihydropteridine diphosphokinase